MTGTVELEARDPRVYRAGLARARQALLDGSGRRAVRAPIAEPGHDGAVDHPEHTAVPVEPGDPVAVARRAVALRTAALRTVALQAASRRTAALRPVDPVDARLEVDPVIDGAVDAVSGRAPGEVPR